MTDEQGERLINIFQGLLLEQKELTRLVILITETLEVMSKQRGEK